MWRNIPGFDGYQASNDGRIRNRRKKLLRQRLDGGGLRVDLGGTNARVHNLVAAAFYGSPLTPGYRVKHANGDRSDNSVGNLYYDGHIPRPIVHRPVGSCRNGHPLTEGNVKRWGYRGNNRICIACVNGEPPVSELPEVL